MELAAYLGTVTGLVALTASSMWAVVSVLGRRIDDLGRRIDDQGASLGARIDDIGASLGARISRLESQNDAILGAVAHLGQRVASLEARES